MLRHRSPAAAAFIAALLGQNAWAGDCTPPTNETCSGAIVFSSADLPLELSAPLGCVNDIIDRPYFDVFYRFDCTRTGAYEIDMCGSVGDTYLRVYSGGCGWTDGEELAVGDDECPGSPPDADPLITVVLEAGQSYWLEIGSWRPDPPFAPPPNALYVLRMRFLPASIPALPVWGVAALLVGLAGLGASRIRSRTRFIGPAERPSRGVTPGRRSRTPRAR